MESGNSTAKVLCALGWISIIGSFLLGIILGNAFDDRGDFNFGIMLTVTAACALEGLFTLALATIIDLLQTAVNRLLDLKVSTSKIEENISNKNS